MRNFAKNLLALTGATSISLAVAGLAYLDRRLHEYGSGLKYGPARHVEYLGDVLHRCNRAAEYAAADTYQKVSMEKARRYDELEEEKERAWNEAHAA